MIPRLALLLILAGCAPAPKMAAPEVIVIHEPARAAMSYSPPIDRACARLVRAHERHPKASAAAAQDGIAYCTNVPAHASRNKEQDARWLRGLIRSIERGR